jgi:hypothetical protein
MDSCARFASVFQRPSPEGKIAGFTAPAPPGPVLRHFSVMGPGIKTYPKRGRKMLFATPGSLNTGCGFVAERPQI